MVKIIVQILFVILVMLTSIKLDIITVNSAVVQLSNQLLTQPSSLPSSQPSFQPTMKPTMKPTMQPSCQPTIDPTEQPSTRPSRQPSSQPSMQPSFQPNMKPTMQPSCEPTINPTAQPSGQPTSQPNMKPTMQPSRQPTINPTEQPSIRPSRQPSRQPSSQPSNHPSNQPSTQPSFQPSMKPTMQPSILPTAQPSKQPFSLPSGQPSNQPSLNPISPSAQPSMMPTIDPSSSPSNAPSNQPSRQPSRQPTMQPSRQPSMQPSRQPSRRPSMQPSRQPSMQPSTQPYSSPSQQPSSQPSVRPSIQPSMRPSSEPSNQPTSYPSVKPSTQPSFQPYSNPSMQPSTQPSCHPSTQPSALPSNPSTQPTSLPSMNPSMQPSRKPSLQPSIQPSSKPSIQPSIQPTYSPISLPSGQPTRKPSIQPSSNPTNPSAQPSRQPFCQPTSQPTFLPSSQPSRQPSSQPSSQPSRLPTNQPSCQPTSFPSNPSSQPTSQPFSQPTAQPTSSPSAFDIEWIVNVTRMDDFLDIFSPKHVNTPIWTLENFCSNSRWKINRNLISPNCTLRLAIQYCIFVRPWRDLNTIRPFDNLRSCTINVPFSFKPIQAESILINFTESAHLRISDAALSAYINTPIRIMINFHNSTLLLLRQYEISYRSHQQFSLTIKNVNFRSFNTNGVINNENHNNIFIMKLCNLESLLLENVKFNSVILSIDQTNNVTLRNILVPFDYTQSFDRRFEIRNSRHVSIIFSTFINGSSDFFGGAICVIGVQRLLIAESHFIGNKAKFGSAIALQRVSSAVFDRNTLKNNIASVSGTIYWIYHSVEMHTRPIENSNLFLNNYASVYGPKISSSFYVLASDIDSVHVETYMSNYFPVNISFTSIDHYGQVIPYQNINVVAIAPTFYNRLLSKCGDNVPKLFGDSAGKLRNGKLRLLLGMECYPTGSAQIGFNAYGLKDYLSLDFPKLVPIIVRKILPISYRACVRGEIYDLNSLTKSTCSVCKDGFSTNDNLVSVATKCTACPLNALNCYSDIVLLKRGTWRWNSESLVIWSCKSVAACIGGRTAGQFSCYKGHEGPLCSICMDGYYANSENGECSVCIKNSEFLLLFIKSIIANILPAVAVGIAINFASKIIDSQYIGCISIVIMNLQVVILTIGSDSSTKISSTSSLSPNARDFSFIKSIEGPLSAINFDVFSSDMLPCFFNYDFLDSFKVQIVLPALLFLSLYILKVFVAYFGKNSTQNIINSILRAMVTLAIFIIPNVSKTLATILKCVDFNPANEKRADETDLTVITYGYSFLEADMRINCGTPRYKFHLIISFLMMIAYPLGIPVAIGYLLNERRKVLMSNRVYVLREKLETLANANVSLNDYYSLILPLESAYDMYIPKYWYVGLLLLVIRLFMVSFVDVLIVEKKHALVINVFVSLLVYRFQMKYNTCRSQLESRVMELGSLQIFFAYLSQYILINSTLGSMESGYVVINVFVVVITLFPAIYVISLISIELFKKRERPKAKDINKIERSESSKVKLKDSDPRFKAQSKNILLELSPNQETHDLLKLIGMFSYKLIIQDKKRLSERARYDVQVDSGTNESDSSPEAFAQMLEEYYVTGTDFTIDMLKETEDVLKVSRGPFNKRHRILLSDKFDIDHTELMKKGLVDYIISPKMAHNIYLLSMDMNGELQIYVPIENIQKKKKNQQIHWKSNNVNMITQNSTKVNFNFEISKILKSAQDKQMNSINKSLPIVTHKPVHESSDSSSADSQYSSIDYNLTAYSDDENPQIINSAVAGHATKHKMDNDKNEVKYSSYNISNSESESESDKSLADLLNDKFLTLAKNTLEPKADRKSDKTSNVKIKSNSTPFARTNALKNIRILKKNMQNKSLKNTSPNIASNIQDNLNNNYSVAEIESATLNCNADGRNIIESNKYKDEKYNVHPLNSLGLQSASLANKFAEISKIHFEIDKGNINNSVISSVLPKSDILTHLTKKSSKNSNNNHTNGIKPNASYKTNSPSNSASQSNVKSAVASTKVVPHRKLKLKSTINDRFSGNNVKKGISVSKNLKSGTKNTQVKFANADQIINKSLNSGQRTSNKAPINSESGRPNDSTNWIQYLSQLDDLHSPLE